MDLLQQLQIWAKGDALQGKFMMAAGIVLAIFTVMILMNGTTIQRGMLIPIGLLIILNLGYGTFVAFTRAGHAQSVEQLYSGAPEQAISQELEKAERDDKTYTSVKPIWGAMLVIGVALFFFLGAEYWKGFALGLLLMGTGGMLIDVFLHHRLQPYLEALRMASGG